MLLFFILFGNIYKPGPTRFETAFGKAVLSGNRILVVIHLGINRPASVPQFFGTVESVDAQHFILYIIC